MCIINCSPSFTIENPTINYLKVVVKRMTGNIWQLITHKTGIACVCYAGFLFLWLNKTHGIICQ